MCRVVPRALSVFGNGSFVLVLTGPLDSSSGSCVGEEKLGKEVVPVNKNMRNEDHQTIKSVYSEKVKL